MRWKALLAGVVILATAAVIVLRKKGVATAGKKASRTTNEGSVASYIHAGGKIGVLVEINCESDFVARTDDFKDLLKDIAMHIAAADPKFVRREDVTPVLRGAGPRNAPQSARTALQA